MGYTKKSKFRDLLWGTIAFKILNNTHNIDILIVGSKETLPSLPIQSTESKTSSEEKITNEDINLGKLKIYIGMAPGVGKTYKMLQEAKNSHKEGKDILLGIIEPHGREATAKLMEGLPLLSPKLIKHQGKYLQEFDLEGAILRKPETIYVDELAHSNVPGAINNKRYQDVQYLLRAGINVSTTVNIQHIESLNDIVEQFSGIKVRETVPDWIISHANDIVLVDISPEALQERVKEGKVYTVDKIETALTHFFQKKNLIALRELSLREVAENVEHEIYPKEKLTKVLSVIDINEDTLRLIRKSARISHRLQGEFIVLHIVKDTSKLLEERKLSIIELEELIVELGGDFRLIEGKKTVEEIINTHKRIKADYVILGESRTKGVKKLFYKSTIKEILNNISDANIWIVGDYTKDTGPI
ncbi:MAG: sensor histidine kinase KdpD [Candidatus Melainabacteria bacterium]|nr:sensor histidine kinase KdpD [Candidatus Melainabacteria bacterium]